MRNFKRYKVMFIAEKGQKIQRTYSVLEGVTDPIDKVKEGWPEAEIKKCEEVEKPEPKYQPGVGNPRVERSR